MKFVVGYYESLESMCKKLSYMRDVSVCVTQIYGCKNKTGERMRNQI